MTWSVGTEFKFHWKTLTRSCVATDQPNSNPICLTLSSRFPSNLQYSLSAPGTRLMKVLTGAASLLFSLACCRGTYSFASTTSEITSGDAPSHARWDGKTRPNSTNADIVLSANEMSVRKDASWARMTGLFARTISISFIVATHFGCKINFAKNIANEWSDRQRRTTSASHDWTGRLISEALFPDSGKPFPVSKVFSLTTWKHVRNFYSLLFTLQDS